MRRPLDLFVGIVERQVEHLRQLATNGRLAHAHHPDKHQRSVDPPRDAGDFGRAEKGRVKFHCRAAYSWASAGCKYRLVVSVLPGWMSRNVSRMRVMKKLAVACALALAAIVVVAWIKGGAQPMQWIEQPVVAGTAPQ